MKHRRMMRPVVNPGVKLHITWGRAWIAGSPTVPVGCGIFSPEAQAAAPVTHEFLYQYFDPEAAAFLAHWMSIAYRSVVLTRPAADHLPIIFHVEPGDSRKALLWFLSVYLGRLLSSAPQLASTDARGDAPNYAWVDLDNDKSAGLRARILDGRPPFVLSTGEWSGSLAAVNSKGLGYRCGSQYPMSVACRRSLLVEMSTFARLLFDEENK